MRGDDQAARRAEALVRRIEQLELELDALLATDCARPSLIPPALLAPAKRRPRQRSGGPDGRGPEIGRRIRDARRKIGMTQLELATATGIRRPNVARLERGGNTPTLETLQRVAAALGVSVASLVSAD